MKRIKILQVGKNDATSKVLLETLVENEDQLLACDFNESYQVIQDNVTICMIVIDATGLGENLSVDNLMSVFKLAHKRLFFGFDSILVFDTSDQEKILNKFGHDFICSRDTLKKTINRIEDINADQAFNSFGYG